MSNLPYWRHRYQAIPRRKHVLYILAILDQRDRRFYGVGVASPSKVVVGWS
jgi:hypothetical protein